MSADDQAPPLPEEAPAVTGRTEVPCFGGGVMVIETKNDGTVWVNGKKVEPAARSDRRPETYLRLFALAPAELDAIAGSGQAGAPSAAAISSPEEHQED